MNRLGGFAAALAAAALFAGCASMGPPTIARDRIDYDQAITTSWKRAMLLNMVKLRYGDTPMFLDVSSIINSYTLEGQLNAGSTITPGPNPTISQLSGWAHFADKPTITYSPLLGERFTRSLMTPLQPAVVVSLIQSGWAADAVMQLMVSSANGVDNRFGSGGRARGADPEWAVVTGALRRIQASAGIGMRVDRDTGRELTVLTLQRKDMTPELAADIRRLRGALGIREDAKEIRVVYGSVPKNDTELALVTRSMLEILLDLAAAIEVPAAHVEAGMAPPVRRFETDEATGYRPLLVVRTGTSAPASAFAAVQYLGQWFWIEEGDYRSKNLFSFVMILFSLMDSAPKNAPLVTVPVS